MAWLGLWAKRIEITVDNTNIDSDLTHFPVPIIINSTAGQDNDDLTVIFDEVGAEDQKIAVTKSDGTTQIYVEVEKWDNTAEEAVLWASKSDLDLTSASTTTLYIYYDSTQSDNTTYVAGVGSRTEVWNSNYEAVWHLGESSGTRIDSTSNNNDLTDNNTVTSGDGKVGVAADLEAGNNEYLSISDNASLSFADEDFSVGLWVKLEVISATHYLSKWNVTNNYEYGFSRTAGGSFQFIVGNGSGTINVAVNTATSAGTWYYLAGVHDSVNNLVKLSVDGGSFQTTAHSAGCYNGTSTFKLGGREATSTYDGMEDEVRIAREAWSLDWIKADYYAMTDNLLSYGAEEAMPTTAVMFLGNF